nr:hypothetical protein Hi04_10k_c2441B_00027 [uncultured bacterium]
MRRAGFLVGLLAAVASAAGAACSALVPDLPVLADAGFQDEGSEAPGADAPTEVDGGDASVGTSDASEGSAPDADAASRVPTFVQGNSFLSSPAVHTSLSATFTSPMTAGDLIVAIVFTWPQTTSQAPVDTMANKYHLAKHQTDVGTNNGDVTIWYAWNCAAATANTNTVTVSVPSNTYQDFIIEEWANVQSSTDPLDVTGGASALTGAPSCSASPTAAGVAIAGSTSDYGQKDAGTGWTLRVHATEDCLAIDQVVSSPGTITPNTMPADDDWAIAVAVFKGL